MNFPQVALFLVKYKVCLKYFIHDCRYNNYLYNETEIKLVVVYLNNALLRVYRKKIALFLFLLFSLKCF